MPVPLDVRLHGYQALLARYFPAERVLLSTGAAARSPGPREAVLGVLVAQNHGASRAVVTLPAREGGSAGAERAFRVYAPGEIGIVPLCLEDPFYSTVTSSTATARTAPGDLAHS